MLSEIFLILIKKKKIKKKKIKKSGKDIGNKDEIDLVDVVGNITSIEKDEKLKKDFNLETLKLRGEEVMKNIVKEAMYEENNKQVENYVDKIKLGKAGWKDRYYMEKFHVSPNVNKKALIDLKQKIKAILYRSSLLVF